MGLSRKAACKFIPDGRIARADWTGASPFDKIPARHLTDQTPIITLPIATMTILGIDTSLRSSGYGILLSEGSKLSALEMGTIKNPPKLPLSACLKNIYGRISELIEKFHPDVIAIESVIYGKNAGTMLLLGEARGAAVAAAANGGVPVYEYEPRRMKMAVCGNGMAEKTQIQRMIKTLLALPELPQNDAADALGLAITHAHSNSILFGREPI